jgi:hypothetical protein
LVTAPRRRISLGLAMSARLIRPRPTRIAGRTTPIWSSSRRGLGLDDRITVRQADVTDLSFGDATFTSMFSQHVQMNVADKALLYAEARRRTCPSRSPRLGGGGTAQGNDYLTGPLIMVTGCD